MTAGGDFPVASEQATIAGLSSPPESPEGPPGAAGREVQSATTQQPADSDATAVPLTDRQLITRARRAKNGATFTRLWKGDTFGFDSRRDADLAFCKALAFWFGRDAARMDRVFRESGLIRPQWDEVYGHSAGTPFTYGQVMIGCALALDDRRVRRTAAQDPGKRGAGLVDRGTKRGLRRT